MTPMRRVAPQVKRRGRKRIIPVEQRAFYTRAEACIRYGFSAGRLEEAIANDASLPMVLNGRIQMFPKGLMDAWFEAAGRRRQNIHPIQE
jgi:hypothetical protein